MPELAPWLQPTDVLGAMQGGTQAGLAAARLRQEGQQSGDRLGLGYAQLNQESARDAIAQKLAAEHLRQVMAHQNALEQFRQEQLAQGAVKQAGMEDYQRGLLTLRGEGNEIAQEKVDKSSKGAGADKLSDVDKLILSDALRNRSAAHKSMMTPDPLGSRDDSAAKALLKDSQDLIDKYSSKTSTGTSAGSPGGLPAEGSIVRSKSTGKTGKIVNGKVVWDEAAAAAAPTPQIYMGTNPVDYETPAGGSPLAR